MLPIDGEHRNGRPSFANGGKQGFPVNLVIARHDYNDRTADQVSELIASCGRVSRADEPPRIKGGCIVPLRRYDDAPPPLDGRSPARRASRSRRP